MSNHQTRIVGKDDAWQAQCACKIHSPVFEHRWEADDWNRTHMKAVEQARLHLKRSLPSLKDQRDWYRKQASRSTDPTVKEQWLSLADELDHRIGTAVLHDDALF
jgi:hypothetical protein